MQSFEYGGTTYTYEGDLDEFTKLEGRTAPGDEPVFVTFGALIAMTNGGVLEALAAG